MARTFSWRSAVWLLLIVAVADSAIWWGFEPPLGRGIVASIFVAVFIVGWHFALLRYLAPPHGVTLDTSDCVDPERVRNAIKQLIDEGRYALLLRPQVAGDLPPDQFAAARQRLETAAALVPGGHVEQGPRVLAHDFDGAPPSLVHVPSFWIDRDTVTNKQFQRFVAAGGYAQAALWESDAQPLVSRFVDRTGLPGPAFWHAGAYTPGTEEQPVVGVSWYEALAYARWAGKRLPTDAQWLKVAGWPIPLATAVADKSVSIAGQPVAAESGSARTNHLAHHRYPWGDHFDAARANLRPGGCGQLVAVGEYSAGSSSHGVNQLLGNVWEWTSDEFEHLPSEIAASRALSKAGQMAVSLKITRGGAFDTDLDDQSAAELIHAECPLARVPNIGFRCALGWNDILPASALAGYQPPPAATWLMPVNPQQARVRQEIAAHQRERNYLRNTLDETDDSLGCAAGSSDSSTCIASGE
jgi:iron(II)-dependent oxidoreductase